jgi:hypothetical protein
LLAGAGVLSFVKASSLIRVTSFEVSPSFLQAEKRAMALIARMESMDGSFIKGILF